MSGERGGIRVNVVVTGAAGFLGTALVKRLLRDGHRVYAVVRPRSASGERFRREMPSAVRVLELDMGQLDELPGRIPVPCPVFFHFGWDGSGSDNRKNARLQQKNVADSLKALEAAGRLGCRRFLFSGSQAEYGPARGLMRETDECHPVSEYGKAKLAFYRQAVRRVAEWNRQEGRPAGKGREPCPMEYIHTRIFSVYGPGDHPWTLVNTCIRTFRENGRMELGGCGQLWNYLYIDDLADGLAALAFREGPEGYSGGPENGIYNLAGDRAATMPLRGYVEEIRRLCGGGGVCAYGTRPPNAEGQVSLAPDITKIKTATGWRPEVSFEEGIRRMLRAEEGR